MRFRSVGQALSAGALLLPVAAHAMTVGDFLAKADALKARGMMAMFSPDITLLKSEVITAGKALRAEQNAANAAHRQASTCMPQPAPMNSDELIGYLKKLPPGHRSLSVKDGLAGYMNSKYPCARTPRTTV